MSIEVAKYFRDDIDPQLRSKVEVISDELLAILSSKKVLTRINNVNKPKTSSAEVQNCFVKEMESLGFKSEAKGLFKNAPNQLLRPDYYLSIGDTGIIVEVERGKVTINNMDLLDFWKCHLCACASILFLIVPNELRQNDKMSPRKEFNAVSTRLSSFFQNGRYANVYALVVYGY